MGYETGFGLLEDGSYRFWLPRRIVLARCSFRAKYWPPYRKRLARLRALCWSLRGHTTEICGRCGGRVRVVFYTPDHIWEGVTGFARHPDGESAPGVLCVPCVDELWEADRERGYLVWTCKAVSR